jgi:hypothetical protein
VLQVQALVEELDAGRNKVSPLRPLCPDASQRIHARRHVLAHGPSTHRRTAHSALFWQLLARVEQLRPPVAIQKKVATGAGKAWRRLFGRLSVGIWCPPASMWSLRGLVVCQRGRGRGREVYAAF